jgi:hypothetical protein
MGQGREAGDRSLMAIQNYINHVVLVLDASLSMSSHSSELIRVADGQVKYLARRSQELDQETRVSVYSFNDTVRCLIYDKDVLRLPSIRDLYRPRGMTALVDATLKSLDDLSQTATLYGDHAFLAFVLTDGQENRSRNRPTTLSDRLNRLPGNWTVACLVPDQRSVFETKSFGFPPENIAVWDATSAAGVAEVGETIRRATDSFMDGRTRGVRGTRSLFSTGIDAVNADTVQANLTPLRDTAYDILPVHHDSAIKDYVISRGLKYTIGKGFYQLTKSEKIQAQKQIAIREKRTGKVYWGDAARDLLGLPRDMEVRVKPNVNPEYDVFVQSTSVNRKLIRDTDLLVLA